jgi:hypothetical protein
MTTQQIRGDLQIVPGTVGAAELITEDVQDLVGAMITGSTQNGVTVTYNDSGGKINFDAQTPGDARYVLKTLGYTSLSLTTADYVYTPAYTGGVNIVMLNLSGLTGNRTLQVAGGGSWGTTVIIIVTAGHATYSCAVGPAAGITLHSLAANWSNPLKADKDALMLVTNDGTNWEVSSQDIPIIYAPAAKGVTNGDSHDHNGGDGAQIAYSTLSGLPTLREVLTANRTYYVRTDGSNSNNGLANTAGGAFLTIQKAIDTVAAIDISIYAVTIQVGSGTYTGAVTLTGAWVGTGTVTLQGDTATPTNVVISTTSATCISLTGAAKLAVQGFKLQTTTGGNCISVDHPGASLSFSSMNFGACAGDHVGCSYGKVSITGNYTISGGATRHMITTISSGVIELAGITVTVSGTPAFSTFAFVQAGMVSSFSCTFSGAATGTRYQAILNGVINTFGGGANVFPGNVAGSTGSGGQYA